MMRQGNELQAGTKHSVFVHFNTKKGFITSDDILLIPEIIEKGNVTPSTKEDLNISISILLTTQHIKL